MSSLDMMHARQAAELQMVRNDMESREREICQLLEDTDLAEMEAELRRLRQQVASFLRFLASLNF